MGMGEDGPRIYSFSRLALVATGVVVLLGLLIAWAAMRGERTRSELTRLMLDQGQLPTGWSQLVKSGDVKVSGTGRTGEVRASAKATGGAPLVYLYSFVHEGPTESWLPRNIDSALRWRMTGRLSRQARDAITDWPLSAEAAVGVAERPLEDVVTSLRGAGWMDMAQWVHHVDETTSRDMQKAKLKVSPERYQSLQELGKLCREFEIRALAREKAWQKATGGVTLLHDTGEFGASLSVRLLPSDSGKQTVLVWTHLLTAVASR